MALGATGSRRLMMSSGRYPAISSMLVSFTDMLSTLGGK